VAAETDFEKQTRHRATRLKPNPDGFCVWFVWSAFLFCGEATSASASSCDCAGRGTGDTCGSVTRDCGTGVGSGVGSLAFVQGEETVWSTSWVGLVAGSNPTTGAGAKSRNCCVAPHPREPKPGRVSPGVSPHADNVSSSSALELVHFSFEPESGPPPVSITEVSPHSKPSSGIVNKAGSDVARFGGFEFAVAFGKKSVGNRAGSVSGSGTSCV
jgi:hypothetical protein|tara:strand:+ start:3970 stop:4611 length:642 start_codon:yes stop_codon:yes gene_type:complete